MKLKKCLKAIVFVALFVLLFNALTQTLIVSSTDNEYKWMTGIYEEPTNSLDAVYLGSSNCYTFWNPLVAWEEYGITVYPYTCSAQPLIAAEYLVKEARKTHPNAVYVININTLADGEVSDVVMHRLLHFMPFSKNKLEFTDYLCDLSNLSFTERLEYYLPMIRYHEKWDELQEGNFISEKNTLKGSNTITRYLANVTDISERYLTSDGSHKLTDALTQSVHSLLDYCEEENVRIVFVTVPRVENSIATVEKLNTVNQLLSDRGFPVIDLMDTPETVYLDTTFDYYDNTHTNIHGSIKFTHFLSQYLIEQYGFDDKRQNTDYRDWNEALEQYSAFMKPYVLDFELNAASRDFSLSPSKEIACELTETGISVSWNRVENADGYVVYKYTANDGWIAVGDTVNAEYTDPDITEKTTYSYTIVPYRIENEQKLYGNYLYNGVKINT